MSKNLFIPDFRQTPTIDQVGVEERAARVQQRSLKKESKIQGLHMALNMIDLTTLKGEVTRR